MKTIITKKKLKKASLVLKKGAKVAAPTPLAAGGMCLAVSAGVPALPVLPTLTALPALPAVPGIPAALGLGGALQGDKSRQ